MTSSSAPAGSSPTAEMSRGGVHSGGSSDARASPMFRATPPGHPPKRERLAWSELPMCARRITLGLQTRTQRGSKRARFVHMPLQ
eukprot:623554-Prorocentrum_minimum.AAC.3